MGREFPSARAAQHIAPPLQPDLSRERLVSGLADAGDFQIERVEGKQRGPMLGGSKQGGEKTVLIRDPDQPLAMGRYPAGGCGCGQSYDVEPFSFPAASSASMRVVPT